MDATSPLRLGVALVGLMLPYTANAAPAATTSEQFGKSGVLLVAGGCGAGFHRGAYGYCVPNGPVVVAPQVCPPGYRLGPYGRRCLPVGAYGPPPGYGPPPPGYGPPPPGYGPPPRGEGPSADYAPPPRHNPRTPSPDQNSPPPPPPAASSPPPGPEMGPPPND